MIAARAHSGPVCSVLPRSRRAAWAGGVASAISYGVTPIVAVTAFADGVQPSVLVTLRSLVGAAAIFALCAVTRRLRPIPRRAAVGLVAVCGPLFGAQILAYFAALERTGAQMAVVVAHIYPIFVIALVSLTTRRPVPRQVLTLCVILTSGIVLVAGTGTGHRSGIGIALAVVSAAGYAIYFVCGERWVHQAGTVAATGLVSFGSAISIGVVALVTDANFALNAVGWSAVALQGLLLIPIGIGGALYAIRRLGSVPMSLLGLLEPVVAIVLAAIFLDESLSVFQWVGVSIVLAACTTLPWATRDARRNAASARPGCPRTQRPRDHPS